MTLSINWLSMTEDNDGGCARKFSTSEMNRELAAGRYPLKVNKAAVQRAARRPSQEWRRYNLFLRLWTVPSAPNVLPRPDSGGARQHWQGQAVMLQCSGDDMLQFSVTSNFGTEMTLNLQKRQKFSVKIMRVWGKDKQSLTFEWRQY